MFQRGSQNTSATVESKDEDLNPGQERVSSHHLQTASRHRTRPAQQEYMETGSKRTGQIYNCASNSMMSIQPPE